MYLEYKPSFGVKDSNLFLPLPKPTTTTKSAQLLPHPKMEPQFDRTSKSEHGPVLDNVHGAMTGSALGDCIGLYTGTYISQELSITSLKFGQPANE